MVSGPVVALQIVLVELTTCLVMLVLALTQRVLIHFSGVMMTQI